MVQLWLCFYEEKTLRESGVVVVLVGSSWWVEGCPPDTPSSQPWVLWDAHRAQQCHWSCYHTRFL